MVSERCDPIVSDAQKARIGATGHVKDYGLFKFKISDHDKKFKEFL
jgi:hypothetical protein